MISKRHHKKCQITFIEIQQQIAIVFKKTEIQGWWKNGFWHIKLFVPYGAIFFNQKKKLNDTQKKILLP